MITTKLIINIYLCEQLYTYTTIQCHCSRIYGADKILRKPIFGHSRPPTSSPYAIFGKIINLKSQHSLLGLRNMGSISHHFYSKRFFPSVGFWRKQSRVLGNEIWSTHCLSQVGGTTSFWESVHSGGVSLMS